MGVLARDSAALAGVFLLVAATVAGAQPSISATGGQWTHNGTVSVSGTGFGSKPSAAPVVWDNASGLDPATKWDGTWPNCSGNSAYNLAYRTPAQVGRNISLPHTNITRYIAGAHYGATPGPQCGYAVILWKTRTMTSYPAYTYASWYQRADNGWRYGDDDNFKTFAYSEGVGPYNMPNNWYGEYNPRPTSPSSGATWHLNDDGPSLQSPDQNGHSWWWGDAVNPMSGSWSKVEMEMKYTNQNDGYIKLWENGVLKIDYRGRTDNYPGSTRTEGIGGYARNYPYTSNWRYFADVYLDYSRARVVLGNAPTLAASTLREVQVPTAWSNTSISVTVNLGAFAPGTTAYVYVVDANGQANTNGRPITVGSGGGSPGDTTPPTSMVTTPNQGASVSGTATVSATAADNVGVTGVQFKLDGNNLGAEDVSAPYGISWDTATVADGSHVLTAVARDAAGNSTASSPVTVTVVNDEEDPPTDPPNPAGLVAAYSFDGGAGTTAADASGNGNTATLAGATWATQGRFGGAVSFDGSNDLVNVADAASLDLSAAMTLEAWIHPTTVSGWRTVLMKENGGGLAYALYANDNAPKPAGYVRLAGNSQSSGIGGAAQVPANAWTHLAVTFNGAMLRLYVNGVEVASQAAAGTAVQTTHPLRIGGNAVWGEYFAGLIDEVRVYNRALTASEIQVDLATPVGGAALPPAAPVNLRVVP